MTLRIGALRLIHHYILELRKTMSKMLEYFLDTHLLKIRNLPHNQKLPAFEQIISKHNASVFTGSKTIMLAVIYITNAMTTAEFREISSDKFKNTYFAPLDKVIKETNFGGRCLAEDYVYHLEDTRHVEDDIQYHSSHKIEDTTDRLYRDICGEYHYFDKASNITPPLAIIPNFSDILSM